MHDNETIVRAKMRDFSLSMGDEIELFLVEKRDGKVSGVGQPIVISPLARGSQVPVMTHLDKHSGQMLIDDLWQCGLRPSEGTGSAGAFAALQSHLTDFRKIVFKQLKIE